MAAARERLRPILMTTAATMSGGLGPTPAHAGGCGGLGTARVSR